MFNFKIAILHEFHKPPWGGGNQFLLALKKEFEKKGIRVVSSLDFDTNICIFNSFTFNTNTFNNFSKDDFPKTFFIHRVDGPTILVRGKDKYLDDKVFEINKLADCTVMQSKWSLNETIKMGYKPKNPVIIQNGVDSDIFNMDNKEKFNKNKKIKLISTSWSDNIRKGFDTYKWLDNNLDFDLYDYTFVGRSPYKFKNIKMIKAQPSKEVADILKQNDVYITASRQETCSNALIEALVCGLPSIYIKGTSHDEIVKKAGIGFTKDNEIINIIARIIKKYLYFQKNIKIDSIEQIADKYLELKSCL